MGVLQGQRADMQGRGMNGLKMHDGKHTKIK